ncbi:NDP-hexose 2,3-dehydratase family protein [Streptomyces sp. NPDC006235]|uniref:NDP-hexose 2,3-dehydratase family protein n=1 Tax=Streptomyces sp. NPDC006235 TaxID=3156736 RepID=UPI0033B206B9
MLSKVAPTVHRAPGALRSREDTTLPARVARSAAAAVGAGPRTEDIVGWLAERTRGHRVEDIAFDELEGWSFVPDTGNLAHRSGRFFSVGGLRVSGAEGQFRQWSQPIIEQPEIGILGILAREIDGVLHFLMQAKMEPGNPNLVQLSPTVQATRSNYTKVHRGTNVRYLEHFTQAGRGAVLVDSLQSEHGSWFHHKRNRNMIVETFDDVPAAEGFCWLTLGQIARLLRRDNVVNMDSRTVLSCLPLPPVQGADRALHDDTSLRSWITGERARHEVRAERIPLREVTGWTRGRHTIDHEDGRYFSVMAVAVQAADREIAAWTQPLFRPHGTGVTAFLRQTIEGVPHLLVHARVEGGFRDTVELGPTVQCTPQNYGHLPEADRPRYLELVNAADPARIRYAALHSEEGGRFMAAQSVYSVVDVTEDEVPLDCPPGYRWVTPAQLASLVRHGHYLNVQARTLLACLTTGAVS